MIATFSSRAGSVASDIEDLAAQGQLPAARSLVEKRLETMAGGFSVATRRWFEAGNVATSTDCRLRAS